jgi:hypothetical protein
MSGEPPTILIKSLLSKGNLQNRLLESTPLIKVAMNIIYLVIIVIAEAEFKVKLSKLNCLVNTDIKQCLDNS